MEELEAHSLEPKSIELWISRQLKAKNEPELIADELLKTWEKGTLSTASKLITCRFCFSNFFYASIIRVIRNDLKSGVSLPWSAVLEIFMTVRGAYSKELVDSILVGSTRDKNLHALAAAAIFFKDEDLRWPKILDSEKSDRVKEMLDLKAKLIDDMNVYKRERMLPELRETLNKLLAISPSDSHLIKERNFLNEIEMDRSIERLRQSHDRRRRPRSVKEDVPYWPQLTTHLDQLKPKLGLESSYYLAIGLQQMGFVKEALQLLRSKKDKWTLREVMYEIDLLLDLKYFAEALELAQNLLKAYKEQSDIVNATLYSSAKAYYGLEDREQAINILKGILKFHPKYRDADLLVQEWESSV